MTRRLFQRRIPLVALFLALALGLVLAGPPQSGTDQANAAPYDPFPGPEIPITKLFLASDWQPAKDATEVPLDTMVRVSFNKEVEAITINDGTFYLKKEGATLKVAAATSYKYIPVHDINTATLDPFASLEPGTTYVAYLVNPILTEDGGASLFNDGSWSFTTITWPEVQTKSPAAGAVDVPVDANVQIHFDKDMEWSTVTSSSFFLQESGGGTVSAVLNKGVDLQSATLNPSADLKEGTTYIATVTVAVRAKNGLYMQAPVTWTFTTAAATPHVTTKVPADGATGVPVGQVVSATFDRDMDDTTITSATFYLQESGGTPLPATVTYSASTQTAALDPLADLEAGTTYEARLTTAVESEGGTPLEAPVAWSFTTAGEAPSVTTRVPEAGASEVPVGQVVSATFDRDMDDTTITSATFYLQEAGGTPLPATVAYSASTRTATLDPLADLEAGTSYEVILSTAVEGADGQMLSGAPVTWGFSTASAGGSGSPFTDIAGSPYETAIIALANEGVILGFEDDTYRPNIPVTRQQFAKMVVLAMGFVVTGAEICPYTDVTAQMGTDPFYPSKYVAVCAAEGITQGKTATTFDPNAYITHQQLITMVARAAGLADPPAAFTPSFTAAQFSLTEHYLNARKAEYAGLLNGLVGIGPTYDFLAPSTRGECAQILYRLLQYMEL